MRLAHLAAGEDKVFRDWFADQLRNLAQHVQRPVRHRHTMFPACLHALGRDRPGCGLHHRAPITSPVRAAVKIANRSASADTPSSLASAAVNVPTSRQGSAE
jgi:hypothetical protein